MRDYPHFFDNVLSVEYGLDDLEAYIDEEIAGEIAEINRETQMADAEKSDASDNGSDNESDVDSSSGSESSDSSSDSKGNNGPSDPSNPFGTSGPSADSGPSDSSSPSSDGGSSNYKIISSLLVIFMNIIAGIAEAIDKIPRT